MTFANASEEKTFTFDPVTTNKIRMIFEPTVANSYYGLTRMIIYQDIVTTFENFNPHVTLAGASWNNFDNQAVINAGSTVFSSVAEIDTVYPAVAFTSDVDLTNTDAVKTFFNNNITPLAQPNVPRYAVGTVNESTAITQAYTGLKLLSEGQTAELSIREVDWTAITPETPSFDLSKSGVNGMYGKDCAISADGNTILASGYKSASDLGGCAFVWEYDETTQTWGSQRGRTCPSGTAHNLSLDSAQAEGMYGKSCDISLDGKTAVISGDDDSGGGGTAWVWQYDEINKTWTNTNGNLSHTAAPNYGN